MKRQNISVIIPLYNKEKFILKLLSVLNQQLSSYDEVIIIDDGSTDNSLSVVSNFINKESNVNIQLITRANRGVSRTRNEGASYAQNEYILFIDADDYLVPGAINSFRFLIEQTENNGLIAMSYFEHKDISTARIIGDDVVRSYIDNEIKICVGSVILKRDIFFKYNGFNEQFSHGEDQLLWLTIGYYEGINYTTKKSLEYIRDDSNSLTLSRKPINVIGQVHFAIVRLKNNPFKFLYWKFFKKAFLYNCLVNINNGHFLMAVKLSLLIMFDLICSWVRK